MKIPEILLVQTERRPGALAQVLKVIAEAGLLIEGLEATHREQDRTTWEITLEFDEGEIQPVIEGIRELPRTRLLGRSDRVFQRHVGGKIQVRHRSSVHTTRDLRDLYTPGVARVCLAIQEDPALARTYTNLPRTVGIVTNGTAILGLGAIGAQAGLPVMEGKSALFSQLSGLSGVPILLDETDPEKLVEAVVAIAPSFGAIQLEDIKAPECFEIERALIRRLDIPVLHDDQHGTAVVALSALQTASRRVGLDLKSCTVGQIGLGAAGIGISRLLLRYGVEKVLGADLDAKACAYLESLGGEPRSLPEIMAEADVVVATTGVRGLIRPEMVRKGQLILALSNPDPEITPEEALAQGAIYAADGRSVNNVLGFPGLFQGALEANAHWFTDSMLFAAAEAISAHAHEGELVPDPLDLKVHQAVAKAVAEAAREIDFLAPKPIPPAALAGHPEPS